MEGGLEQLVQSGDAASVASHCEQCELNLDHASLAPEASAALYKAQLAAYLLTERLDDARFLWKRLPAMLRDSDPELGALWAIGRVMWLKDAAAAQAAMRAHAWSPLIAPLVAQLQREQVTRMFGQVAKAYTHVSAESLAQSLGVPVQTVHEMATAASWTTDAESGAYVPVANESAAKAPFMQKLERFTEYIAHVEKDMAR